MTMSARLRRDAAILLVMTAAASSGGCARTVPGPRVPALPLRSAQSPSDLAPSASCEGVVHSLTEAIVRRASRWVDAQRATMKAECSGKPLGPDDCLNLGGSAYDYDFCADPLKAGGYGPRDATLVVRPGPVGMGSGPRPAAPERRDAAE